MPESLDIVRLQAFRDQFRITIPHEMIEKLKWEKGQPLFIVLDGSKLVIEQVTRKG